MEGAFVQGAFFTGPPPPQWAMTPCKQPPAWSRIRLEKRNTSSSSNPNYIFFETASIPKSDMEKGKRNAANKNL